MIATVNWQYLILRWPTGGVYRVKRRTDGPPPVSDGGSEMVGADAWAKTAPASMMFNGEPYKFAFWSITASDALSPQREAHVEVGRNLNLSHAGAAPGGGSWVINATAYFVRDIGVGGGDHGIFIDAFDVQAGDFIADDFVVVSPDDAGHTLTASANNGYFDTTTQLSKGNPVKVTALDVLSHGFRRFQFWQDVPTLVISSDPNNPALVGAPDPHDLTVNVNDIVYAFAFYNEQEQSLHIPRQYWTYDPWWWFKTHGGLTPPLPDPEPWLQGYLSVIALAQTAKQVSPQLRGEVIEIAMKQVSLVGNQLKKQLRDIEKGKGEVL
jgi:hypothetical protein